MTQFKSYFFIV